MIAFQGKHCKKSFLIALRLKDSHNGDDEKISGESECLKLN